MHRSRVRRVQHGIPISLQWLPRLVILGMFVGYFVVLPRMRNPGEVMSLSSLDATQLDEQNTEGSVALKTANASADSQDLDKANSENQSPPTENDPLSPPIEVPNEESEAANRDTAQMSDLLSVVRDGTLKLRPREMPAYWRLMRQAATTKPSELWDQARPTVSFNNLYQSPTEHRGELMRLEVNVRRIMKYPITDPNADGLTEIYEVWGWTNHSKAWMYCLLTPQLPPGMPEGDFVQKRGEFAGYFFKLQGYQPAGAAPNAPPLLAPLLIGRFTSSTLNPADAQAWRTPRGWWFGAAVVVLAIWFLWSARRMLVRPPAKLNPVGDANMFLKGLDINEPETGEKHDAY